MEQLVKWQQARYEEVTGAQGDLSLIAMHDIATATTVKEFKGRWKPTVENEPGLTLIATPEDRLFCNGELVVGSLEVIADETVVRDEFGRTGMATSQPGSHHLLAIWDSNHEALKNFSHIESFPYNKQAVYNGTLELDEDTFQFSHTRDEGKSARQHHSIGCIHVDIDGQDYALRPFQSGAYSIIVFRDTTSGVETYGMGRMLIVQINADGSVVLDFNRAFLPPCAFSPYFNCPMPPMSNRIQTKIEAGEKQVVFKTL